MIRGVLATVGTLCVLVVGLLAVDPALASAVPVDAAVAFLGNDYIFISLFGGLALVFLLVVLWLRILHGLNQATPPSPETVQPAPRFGAEFDDAIDSGRGAGELLLTDRDEAVRTRLRTNAVRSEMAAEGCGRRTAEQRVETGAWTDDDAAATFLDESTGPTPGERMRAFLHGRTWFQRGARRTAAAVVRKAEGGDR